MTCSFSKVKYFGMVFSDIFIHIIHQPFDFISLISASVMLYLPSTGHTGHRLYGVLKLSGSPKGLYPLFVTEALLPSLLIFICLSVTGHSKNVPAELLICCYIMISVHRPRLYKADPWQQYLTVILVQHDVGRICIYFALYLSWRVSSSLPPPPPSPPPPGYLE